MEVLIYLLLSPLLLLLLLPLQHLLLLLLLLLLLEVGSGFVVAVATPPPTEDDEFELWLLRLEFQKSIKLSAMRAGEKSECNRKSSSFFCRSAGRDLALIR